MTATWIFSWVEWRPMKHILVKVPRGSGEGAEEKVVFWYLGEKMGGHR